MVAIKVIEHNADDNSKMDGLRESLLCSSIQHPNVVRPRLLFMPCCHSAASCKVHFIRLT